MSLKKIDTEAYFAKERQLEEQVKIEDGFIVIALPDGSIEDSYEISLDRIKTPDDVIAWFYHLLEKQWIDRDVLRRFTKLASNHVGVGL